MITSLIVAVAKNYAIGKDNNLLWHLPNDMKYFKEKTLDHHIITGRKNYISIPERFRPLVNRTNIVLSRNTSFTEEGCIVKHSLEAAIAYAKDAGETELFIIGGGEIYKEALESNLIDKMYITHVDSDYEGDTFFPEVDKTVWNKQFELSIAEDEKHAHPFSFAVYNKIK